MIVETMYTSSLLRFSQPHNFFSFIPIAIGTSILLSFNPSHNPLGTQFANTYIHHFYMVQLFKQQNH